MKKIDRIQLRSILMQHIAQHIVRLVAQKGWTQAEAAARCGVTRPQISDLLRGHTTGFSLEALVSMVVELKRKAAVKPEHAA